MPEIIVRKKNIKKMYLRVRDRKIFISAPLWTSERQINRFIQSNKAWIQDKLKDQTPKQLDSISILEKNYPIIYTENSSCLIKEDEIYLDPNHPELLRRLILTISMPYFEQRFYQMCHKMHMSDLNFQLKFYKSKWGSYHWKTKTIRLNALLALTDKECIDAIFVHELCHVKWHDHSSHFYEEVIKWMPTYKKAHRRLNAYSIPKI